MAATNYTPIYLYNSGTTTNVPTNTNLGAGELAINYTDGKLFYKDNANVVQVIATKASAAITLPIKIENESLKNDEDVLALLSIKPLEIKDSEENEDLPF